jgi:oligopeptide/dipeptide ABC transporter ATP-binding protein
MYLAQLVEEKRADQVVKEPLHPYTKALLSAIPLMSSQLGLERVYLKGEIGDPANPPKGCLGFHEGLVYFSGDPGFPRPVEAVSPRRLVGSHCGEWARGDR